METLVQETTALEDAQAELKAAVADLKEKRQARNVAEDALNSAEGLVAEADARYRKARERFLRIGGDEDPMQRFR